MSEERSKYLSIVSIMIWLWALVVLFESFALAIPLISSGKTSAQMTKLVIFSVLAAIVYSFLAFGIRMGNKKIATTALVISLCALCFGFYYMPLLFAVIGPFGLLGVLIIPILILLGWKQYKKKPKL
ncbi:MAG: hypothetical protein WCJ71_00275 [Candidatus Omnitrophota bacterium]